jgi:hypothetical protein
MYCKIEIAAWPMLRVLKYRAISCHNSFLRSELQVTGSAHPRRECAFVSPSGSNPLFCGGGLRVAAESQIKRFLV